MLPNNVESMIPVPGVYLPPDDEVTSTTIDYELGGVAINDATQGLNIFRWQIRIAGSEAKIQREGQAETTLFSASDMREIGLAFDQNMRPHVVYKAGNGNMLLRWFDSTLQQYVTTDFGPARTPRIALDDKRVGASSTSDVVLAYLRGSSLFYRLQRDRFGVERTLRAGLSEETRLRSIGMARNLRMNFELV